MKHLKLRIVSIILASLFMIFAASLLIINVLLPHYFEKQAESTLLYELSFYNAERLAESSYSVSDGDTASGATSGDSPLDSELYSDVLYKSTFLSGSVNSLLIESPKLSDDSYLVGHPTSNVARRSAEEVIRDYCESNDISEGKCYRLRNADGYYVFVKFSDGSLHSALYIDIQPFIQYTALLNWILFAALAVAAAVMCAIGLRLGRRIEDAQNTQQQFFQNASHELKTPLMSIQGYAEGIQAGVLPPDSAVDVILEESDKMTGLVEELLEISKLDVKHACGKMEVCDVRDVLDGCLADVDMPAKQRGISIAVDFPEQAVNVLCCEAQLRRAFLNILTNGLRYARHTLGLSCRTERRCAVITIHDDGRGIDDSDLDHIFDRFYSGRNGNTGIGLALAREVITLHKGTISAENRNGGVFEVRLPLAP